MPITLIEDTIRSCASAQSFERGREYYDSGAIYNTIRQSNILFAECEGTETYHLRVELDEGGIRSASCTCPYEFGGYCKHIVALLLTYLHGPEQFTERKSLSVLLENVDQATLVALLTKLADRHPVLYDWLATTVPPVAIVADKGAESQPQPKRQSQVSEQAYRKHIKNILRPARYDDYEYGATYGVSSQLDEVCDSAEELLKAGDAQGAITVLVALLDELSDTYEMYDDSDGELGDSGDYAGQMLAEAILSADLTAKERKALEHKLAPIVKNLSDYGVEDGLELAQLALKYGWNEPGADDDDERDENGTWYDDEITDLTEAKLNVLERQERTSEFLALCQKSGAYLRCILKLLQIGQADEAIHAASSQLHSPDQILEVAKALREADHLSDAITLAEHGLSLEGQKYHLATWLAPLEESQGRTEQALQAHLASFASSPSLETYKNIQRLSGERWIQLKPRQMEILLQLGRSDAIASVYLHEQQWDEAIAVAEKQTYDYSLREKVADAVISHRPDWVIRVSIKEAEELIEKTQSKYYPHAARWLAKVKKAHIQSGRAAEWQAYFTQLKSTYARRPALQKELAKL